MYVAASHFFDGVLQTINLSLVFLDLSCMPGSLVSDEINELNWIRMKIPARCPTEHRFTALSRS